MFLSRYKYEKITATGQKTDAKCAGWWKFWYCWKKWVISFSADDTSDKIVSSQTCSYHQYKNI